MTWLHKIAGKYGSGDLLFRHRGYDASRCRFLLMPWKRGGLNLYVFDREEKTLTVLDPSPIPDWCKDMPYKRYMHRIINVFNNYRLAIGVQAPECVIDVFAWKHILPSGIPVIEDSDLDAFILLQFMSAWNNRKLMPISTVSTILHPIIYICVCIYILLFMFVLCTGWSKTTEEICDRPTSV
ncbi:hypothetical protein BDA96_07G139600 [Sorghum bicolor]|uniref:Uncharacterized protein n=1 Tax=Sorghum bicolor TaxID=4558 RepID=A0A921U9V3_SORBI|nr:hypothetical protein BDA96_07G139600 [Sorghum bicolor]